MKKKVATVQFITAYRIAQLRDSEAIIAIRSLREFVLAYYRLLVYQYI